MHVADNDVNIRLMKGLQEDLEFAAEEATSWMHRARAHETFLDYLSMRMQQMLTAPPAEAEVVFIIEKINRHLQAHR